MVPLSALQPRPRHLRAREDAQPPQGAVVQGHPWEPAGSIAVAEVEPVAEPVAEVEAEVGGGGGASAGGGPGVAGGAVGANERSCGADDSTGGGGLRSIM